MTTLVEVADALIQARVVALGALVHTKYECGHWHAYDWRTYDGTTSSAMGTSPHSERTAIIELLDQLEERL